MTQNPLVNFFIIGAPKCGTTAMAAYLSEHPDICMSNPKEPHFFCDDFPNIQGKSGVQSIEDYHKAFFEEFSGDKHKIVGEASVWYLYSKSAIENILRYNQEAKFLVMIRNPIEMINSLHSMYLGLGFEYESSLKKALELENVRVSGKKINQHPLADLDLLLYSRIGKLGEQLQRLYTLVPKYQVKVVIYDDFKANTDLCYTEILSFLGVDVTYKSKDKFSKINAQKRISSSLIQRIYINQTFRKTSKLIKKILKIKSFGIGIAKIPLSEQERQIVNSVFRNDVKLLAELTDRDFSSWIS